MAAELPALLGEDDEVAVARCSTRARAVAVIEDPLAGLDLDLDEEKPAKKPADTIRRLNHSGPCPVMSVKGDRDESLFKVRDEPARVHGAGSGSVERSAAAIFVAGAAHGADRRIPQGGHCLWLMAAGSCTGLHRMSHRGHIPPRRLKIALTVFLAPRFTVIAPLALTNGTLKEYAASTSLRRSR